jgi:hypothetical protein
MTNATMLPYNINKTQAETSLYGGQAAQHSQMAEDLLNQHKQLQDYSAVNAMAQNPQGDFSSILPNLTPETQRLFQNGVTPDSINAAKSYLEQVQPELAKNWREHEHTKSMEAWHMDQNDARREAAQLRADAAQAAQKQTLNKLSRPPTGDTLSDEQSILTSIKPEFGTLDAGAKNMAARDVYTMAHDLYKANSGNPDYSEEDAYNEARSRVLSRLQTVPGNIWHGFRDSTVYAAPHAAPATQQAAAQPPSQGRVSFAPDPGYTPTPDHVAALQKAVDAIKSGKDPQLVQQRLRQNGIMVNVQ